MKLYHELAWIWSVMTPPDAYQEEAESLWQILCSVLGREPENILEFGCGGGYLLHHMPKNISACMVDISDSMLRESRKINPEKKHLLGDMLTIDCGERFDVVLVHDAIMYLQSASQIAQLLKNCKRHLKKEGQIVLIPDAITETFYERHFVAAAQGVHNERDVSIRFMEWHWDPEEDDELVQVEFSALIREGKEMCAVHESHTMLVLPLASWMQIFAQAGLVQSFPAEPWLGGGEFFLLSRSS